MRRAAAVAFALVLALEAAAGTQLAFVRPGGPGSTEQAAKSMAEFARALETAEPALAPVAATYFNQAEAALAFIVKEKPDFAFVSTDFYLRWRATHALVPVAGVRVAGREAETFSVLVAKDGPRDLAGLAGKRLAGNWLADPRFVSAVALGGKLDAAKSLALQPEPRPLRAIRAVIRGGADALLVDAQTLAALRQLPEESAKLKVIFTSAPCPEAPVVRIAGRGDPARLVAALARIEKTDGGRAVLETFQLAGFAAVAPEAYRAVEAAYDGWPPREK